MKFAKIISFVCQWIVIFFVISDYLVLREDEHAKLLLELEKLPKISSRKSYIQRITEITKNSWKQDADIDRIIKETRKLQLESNSIQERLHRTYAVVEETVFRYDVLDFAAFSWKSIIFFYSPFRRKWSMTVHIS